MAVRALVIFLLSIFFQECGSQSTKHEFELNNNSSVISYSKDSYEVERTWVEINDTDANLRYAFFIHTPVKTDSVELIPTLPAKEWQYEHFKTLETKIGTVAAMKLSKGSFHQAVSGKLQNEKYPVFIFGPGLGWLPSDYYELILPLARKGIIVVTVFSLPVSKVIQFPDGSIDKIDKAQLDYELQAKILASATKKIIELSVQEDTTLNGKIDVNKIIVGGHSVSGAAALLAATKYQGIKGIINLDGDVTEEIAQKALSQPILYITSQPTQLASPVVAKWSEDRSEVRRDNYFRQNIIKAGNWIRIKIPEMYHLDFLDAAALRNDIPEKLLHNRFGSINPSYSAKLVSEAMINFISDPFAPASTWEKFNKSHTGVHIEARK